MDPIIIIGAGLAGYSVARELRKLDKTTPVMLIARDSAGFYSKPMLSNAFAQGKQAAQLQTQNAEQMAAQQNITVLGNTEVLGIAPEARQIHTSSGDFTYSKLVLALGAQAIRLPIEGEAAGQIMSINHLDDYARFRAALAQVGEHARVVILGAGLIGCEFADDLASAGHLVTLIDPSPRPLAALAAPELSLGLQAALQGRGIRFHLDTTVQRVEPQTNALQVSLANGTQLDADIVLSAVGLRPDLRLALAAGLATGRGIRIDAYGQTSDSAIYALGDCAEYTLADGSSACLPYIAPILQAARALALTLGGEPKLITLPPAPVLVKTPTFPLALMPPGAGMGTGCWHSDTIDGQLVCRFRDDHGRLLGFGLAPHNAATRTSMLAELATANS